MIDVFVRRRKSRIARQFGACVQINSHHFQVLEGRQTVYEAVYMQSLRRRGSLLMGAFRSNHQRDVEDVRRASKSFLTIMLDRIP
jgi:hypothetical protein